jgi:hypothetical protein
MYIIFHYMTTPQNNNQLLFKMFRTNYINDVKRKPECPCGPKAAYLPVVTGGNDPSISASARYSQMVNSARYTTISVAAAIAAGILNADGTLNTNNRGNTAAGAAGAGASIINVNQNCPIHS